jgi:hypothetical protein
MLRFSGGQTAVWGLRSVWRKGQYDRLVVSVYSNESKLEGNLKLKLWS